MSAPVLRCGSLFSGAGGLDLAVNAVLGAVTVWHAETDPAATAVLAARWPGVPNLGDVAAVDFAQVARDAPVDVLTAGFPCQDVSTAGRRAGLRPGTRSGLWSHTRYAISRLRPALVVIETGSLRRGTRPGTGIRRDPPLGSETGQVAHHRGSPAAHPHHLGPQRPRGPRHRRDGPAHRDLPTLDWGPYEPAIRRWELTLGRPAPAPTQPGRRGGRQLAPRFVEWLMGLPEGWVTAVPGLTRNQQLAVLGNGVVPQQAAAAIPSLLTHTPTHLVGHAGRTEAAA